MTLTRLSDTFGDPAGTITTEDGATITTLRGVSAAGRYLCVRDDDGSEAVVFLTHQEVRELVMLLAASAPTAEPTAEELQQTALRLYDPDTYGEPSWDGGRWQCLRLVRLVKAVRDEHPNALLRATVDACRYALATYR